MNRKKTMKKIKHIKDIQEEKMRLRIQQLEQEKNLQQNWNETKLELRPGTLLRNQMAASSTGKEGENSLFTGLVSLGAGYLTRRFTGLAGQKIENTVQMGIEKLANRMQAYFHFNIHHKTNDGADKSGQGKFYRLRGHIHHILCFSKIVPYIPDPEIPGHAGNKRYHPFFLGTQINGINKF